MAPIAYGKLQTVYHADPVKLIINLALGIFLSVLGVVAIIAATRQERETIILVGILASFGGLVIFLRTMIYNFGQEIRLYEKGLEFRRFWQSRRYFYEQVTGIQVTATVPRKGLIYIKRDYTFYDDYSELFRITPIYFNWAGLGEELMNRITEFHRKRQIHRIQNGFELVYNELLEIPHLDKKVPLKINLYGLVEEDKPLLPWSRLGVCQLDRGYVVIKDVDGEVYSQFPYFNTVNSYYAMLMINTLVDANS